MTKARILAQVVSAGNVLADGQVDVTEIQNLTNTYILNKVKEVDGATSGLDSDLLDGLDSSSTNTASTVMTRNSNGHTGIGAINFDTTNSTIPTTAGSLYWANEDGNKTLSLVMQGGNVVQQLGEEQYYRIKASSTITNGQVVMFTGTVGNSGALLGAPATGLTAETASYIMGVATENISVGNWGYVTSFGLVREINTTAYNDGDILYYNPSVAGGLTSTPPSSPNAKIQVCSVVHSHSHGSLFVRPTFGGILGQYEGDVNITSPSTGDLLIRNQTTGVWENKPQTSITQLGTITAENITITGELVATSPVAILGDNVTSITSEPFSILTAAVDINAYRELSIINKNSGSDASADFVAYNDASGAESLGSFFIDMGINSSNFSSTEYPIFPANSGYLFTAGGPDEENPQPSHLYIGTGTPDSDVIIFAGGTTLSDRKVLVKADTGNLLINTINDDGLNKLQVNGGANFTGSINVDGSLYLGGAITLPTQAATKAYVDNAAATGIHIHDPVRVEKHGSWTVTYADGGSTLTVTTIASNKILTTSAAHNLLVNDVVYFTTTTNGLTLNTPYFVFSTPTTDTFTLAATYLGEEIHTLTNGTSLSITCKANTGVGATLTNAGTQAALTIGGISLQVNDRVAVIRSADKYQNGVYVVTNIGSGSTNWVLTRASDNNKYAPHSIDGISDGDYFYVQEGSPGAGESYVITTDSPILFGISDIIFTLFNAGVAYSVQAPLNLTGTTLALTGVVGETNGGTGQSTVTTGDLLYGSGSNTWSKLSLGTAYKSLIVNATGTQLEWNAVALNQSAAVSGQLGLSNGGTGSNLTASAGGILYSTSSAINILNAGTSSQVLVGGTTPSWTSFTSSNTANAIVTRDASGNFTANVITAVDFNATSDPKLKQNVVPAPGLEALMPVNAVGFNWIDGGEKSYGVLADEFAELFPELVQEVDGIKTVKYIPIIAMLIKSVQELNTRVKELENNV